MHKIVQAKKPQDYVIVSGLSHSLREFVDAAFAHAGLDPQDRLEVTSSLMRPTDLSYSAMDPGKINSVLSWRSSLKLSDIVDRMSTDALH